MNRLYSWFLKSLLTGRKALSRSSQGLWSGVTEAVLASLLIILGILLFVVVVAVNAMFSTPKNLYMSIEFLAMQLVLSSAMISFGTYLVLRALWSVGASAERRQALASQAGEIELFAEFRRQRDDLPTVPTALFPPVPGLKYPYRLLASRQSLWGMITAGVLSIVFAVVSAMLVITAIVKYIKFETTPFTAKQISTEQFSADWFAGALAIPVALVAIWALYKFVGQLLKLTSIGATTVEFSRYPLFPGEEVEIFLSQIARSRLKFIDVVLKCVEQTTFNEGTNTLTEQREVFAERLFRKRGVESSYEHPFETMFNMTIPEGAMHTFSSSCNRIVWKIEIRSQIKGYPEVIRNFEFILQPTGKALVVAKDDQQPKRINPAR